MHTRALKHRNDTQTFGDLCLVVVVYLNTAEMGKRLAEQQKQHSVSLDVIDGRKMGDVFIPIRK